MSKILNINDDIKINKNNLQTPYTIVRKSSGSSTTIKFTLESAKSSDGVLILIDQNYEPALVIVAIHSQRIVNTGVIVSGATVKTTTSITDNTITITVGQWAGATLIDFSGNSTWS